MKRAALLLAVSAGVLGAPALYAQIIGQQSGILGGEEGLFRPSQPPEPPTAIAIDALPYTETLVCGSYTLTGTSEGADSVAWSASPGGSSGSCTGTDTWSCVVSVSPTSAATATPTITVTATSAGGTLDATTNGLGFFPGTAYSCHLAQNIDGDRNSTLTTLDAIATWLDSGAGGYDLDQGTGASQPTYYAEIDGSNGQPLVYCDGGDLIDATTAADWTFLHSAGTERTVIAGAASRLPTPSTTGTIATNKTNTDAALGWRMLWTVSTAKSAHQVGNGSAGVLNTVTANESNPGATLGSWVDIIDDDGGGGDDGFVYINEALTQAAATGALSASNGGVLTLCNRTTSSGSAFTGWISHHVTYERVLTAGEIAAADAVIKWAFGSSDVPVMMPTARWDASVLASITKDGSDRVSDWDWPVVDYVTVPTLSLNTVSQATAGAKPTYLSANGGGIDFDGTDDLLAAVNGSPKNTTTTGWIIAVARIYSVGTNVTSSTCDEANDQIVGNTSNNYGLNLRETGGTRFLVGFSSSSTTVCSEAALPIDTDPHILEWQFTGGNVCVAVDGGTPGCQTAGGTPGTASVIRMGKNFAAGTFADVTIHEVVWYASYSDAERTRILDELQAKWGTP